MLNTYSCEYLKNIVDKHVAQYDHETFIPDYMLKMIFCYNKLNNIYKNTLKIDMVKMKNRSIYTDNIIGKINNRDFVAKIGLYRFDYFIYNIYKNSKLIGAPYKLIIFTFGEIIDVKKSIPKNINIEAIINTPLPPANEIIFDVAFKFYGMTIQVNTSRFIIVDFEIEIAHLFEFLIATGKIPHKASDILPFYNELKKIIDNDRLFDDYEKILQKYFMTKELITSGYFKKVYELNLFIEKNRRAPKIEDNIILWAVYNEYNNMKDKMMTNRKELIEKYNNITNIAGVTNKIIDKQDDKSEEFEIC